MLGEIRAFYGEFTGLRTARKHIGWYVADLPGGELFRARMNALESCERQREAVDEFFAQLGPADDALPISADKHRLAA